jgi:hypothetical protein
VDKQACGLWPVTCKTEEQARKSKRERERAKLASCRLWRVAWVII